MSHLSVHASEGCMTRACLWVFLSQQAHKQNGQWGVAPCKLWLTAWILRNVWESGGVGMYTPYVEMMCRFCGSFTSWQLRMAHTYIRACARAHTHTHKWKKKLVYPLNNPHRDCHHIFGCQSVEKNKTVTDCWGKYVSLEDLITDCWGKIYKSGRPYNWLFRQNI